MAIYIGVDLHARTQTVCRCDTAAGDIHQEALDHQGDDVRTFCAWFAAPAVVGLESSGSALWFHQLLDELGHEVLWGQSNYERIVRREWVTPFCSE